MKKIVRTTLNESINIDNEIFTDAIWGDGDDNIIIHVFPNGTVYGRGDEFDFNRNSKKEAYDQLIKWGYHYIGVN